MKILGMTKVDTKNFALASLRLIWPFNELNKAGHKCVVMGEREAEAMIRRRSYDLVKGYDLYVIQRMLHPHQGRTFEGFRSQGAKVVLELDDDLTDRHRNLGRGQFMQATIDNVDAVTVSTPGLAKLMRDYGKPVYTLPNHLDVDWFCKVSRKAERVFDGLVIGLVGTKSHWGDWIIVSEALKKIKENYPDVIIACGHYRPPYLEDALGSDLEMFAGIDYRGYPGMMRQFDIVLCPLDFDDMFNHSKSAIGALDAMAAERPVNGRAGGAVAVCSNVRVYRRVVNNGSNGVLVRGSWYDAVAELIEDKALRDGIAVNGLRWVKKNRDIKRGYRAWVKAYAAIMEGRDG